MRVPRRVAVLTVAAAAACVAVSACGSVQMGAAAISGGSRISTGTLTAEVANLNAAYKADRAKNISPQQPAGQETQQVLTWLLSFRIYDQIAVQHQINITAAQLAQQYTKLSTAAKQSNITVAEYVSAAGALPPDLVPQLARANAIVTVLENRITGGKTPTSSTAQTQLQTAVEHAECVASKSLAISVNPQYGQFDYSSYAVVPAPSTLAADPTPSKPAAVKTTPPC